MRSQLSLLDLVDFIGREAQRPTDVRGLLLHLDVASRRMNFSVILARFRDRNLRCMFRSAKHDSNIMKVRDQYPLVAIPNTTPFEAYCAKPCSAACAAIKQLHGVLYDFWRYAVMGNVGRSNEMRPSSTLVDAVLDVSQRVLASGIDRPVLLSVSPPLMERFRDVYLQCSAEVVRNYHAEMNAVHAEWRYLNDHFKLWDSSAKEIYNDLPFVQWRLQLESPSEYTVPVLKFFMVEPLIVHDGSPGVIRSTPRRVRPSNQSVVLQKHVAPPDSASQFSQAKAWEDHRRIDELLERARRFVKQRDTIQVNIRHKYNLLIQPFQARV